MPQPPTPTPQWHLVYFCCDEFVSRPDFEKDTTHPGKEIQPKSHTGLVKFKIS